MPQGEIKHGGLTFYVARVSPKQATQWLDQSHHFRNRSVNQRHADWLAGIMERDQWILNGEPLIFDKDDVLINGQHRCWASIMSDQSFRTVIIKGVDRTAFRSLDTGRNRNLTDAISIGGENLASRVAPIVNLQFQWTQGMYSAGRELSATETTRKPTIEQGIEILAEYPEITSAPTAVGSTVRWTHIFPVSTVGWIYFHATNHDIERADQWVTGVRDGIGLPEDSPILALRLRMQRHYGGVSVLRSRSILFGAIKSWNAFAADRPLRRVAVGTNERPPILTGDRSPPRDYEKR